MAVLICAELFVARYVWTQPSVQRQNSTELGTEKCMRMLMKL